MRHVQLSFIPWLVSFGLVMGASSAQARRWLEPTKQWTGQVTDGVRMKEMEKEAPADGIITNKEDFAKLWKAWMPKEEIPTIDFDKELVIVFFQKEVPIVTEPRFLSLIEEKGDGKVFVTLGFSFAIGVFNREGLKTISGKPIKSSGVPSSQIEASTRPGTRPPGDSSVQAGSGERAAVRGATREYLDTTNGLTFQYPTAWKEMGPAEARRLMGAATSQYLTVVVYDPGDWTQNVNVQVVPTPAKDLTEAAYNDFAKQMDRQMPNDFSKFQKVSSRVGKLLDMASLEYVFEATRPDGVRIRQKQLRTGKPGREVVATFTAKADLYQRTDEACFRLIVDTLKLK